MKTFKRIGLFVILLFISNCGKSQENTSIKVIKDTYRLEGNKVYFDNAEIVIKNGVMYAGTEFSFQPPKAGFNSNEKKRWIQQYRDYHKNHIATGRINYFIAEMNITPDMVSNYSFIVQGFYANFQYVFKRNDKSYSLYQIPLEWHDNKIEENAK